MDAYRTEQEQIEQLKSWIKTLAPSVVMGAILAFALGFGWQYWQKKVAQKSDAAARAYMTMINSSQLADTKETEQAAHNLLEHFANTPYASWAAMELSKIAVKSKNYDEAKKQLQWVIDNSRDDAVKQTARLRLARVFIQQNQGNEALSLLEKMNDNSYQALILEEQGDAYLSLNKIQEAKDAYLASLDSYSKQQVTPPELLTLKLHNLYSISTLENKGQE